MRFNWLLATIQIVLIYLTLDGKNLSLDDKWPFNAEAQTPTIQELQLELMNEDEIEEEVKLPRQRPKSEPKPKPKPKPELKQIRSPDIYVPPELVDGQITVKLKDGAQYRFLSNEFKVVRRLPEKPKKKPKPPAEKPIVITKVVDRIVERPVYKKHTIKFLAGAAYCDLQVTESEEDKIVLAQRQKPTFGVGYDYKFSQKWSMGVQAFSDESAYASVGFSF